MSTAHLKNSLDEIFGYIERNRVLVIGDLMLDEYVYGHADCMSAEAPVPIFKPQFSKYKLGGAANAAANIIALGGKATVCGAIVEDSSGELILDELHSIGAVTDHITTYNTRDTQTTLKRRLMVDKAQMMRIDTDMDLSFFDKEKLYANVREALQFHLYRAILISDYDKGVLDVTLISEIMTFAISNKIPVIADPKNVNFWHYEGVTALTPNRREYERALADNPYKILSGSQMREFLDVDNLVVTHGKEGIGVWNKEHPEGAITNVIPVKEIDACGAGDVFSAALTLAISESLVFDLAVEFANLCAAASVTKQGTVAVTPTLVSSVI